MSYTKTYTCDIGESQTGGRIFATVYEPEAASVTDRVRGSFAVQGDGPETLGARGAYRGHGTLIPNLPTYHLPT